MKMARVFGRHVSHTPLVVFASRLAACLALMVSPCVAQPSTQLFNGDVIQFGPLAEGGKKLYAFNIPDVGMDAEIILRVTEGDADMYINGPGRDYPDTEDYQWRSIHGKHSDDKVFISRHDTAFQAGEFKISIVGYSPVSNFVVYLFVSDTVRSLAAPQQAAMEAVFARCCSAPGSCSAWKSQRGENLDFCHHAGAICTAGGDLEFLDLAQEDLTCEWPPEFSSFPALKKIDLGNNNINGSFAAVAASIATMPGLQILDLTDNGFTGDFGCLDGNSHLRLLNLQNNELTGSLGHCIASLSNVTELYLGGNMLGGALPDTWPADHNLHSFNFQSQRGPGMVGTIPPAIFGLLALRNLVLAGLGLEGTIPEALSSGLQTLLLGNNNITGSLPASLAQLPSLEAVDVSNNKITGSIPTGWSPASPLWFFSAGDNAIDGLFPDDIMRVPDLRFLYLDNNKIRGGLPSPGDSPGGAGFSNLRQIDLSRNELSGSMSPSWSLVPLFWDDPYQDGAGRMLANVFNVSGNQLSGEVPNFIKTDIDEMRLRGVYVDFRGNDFSCPEEQPLRAQLASFVRMECPEPPPPPPGPPGSTPAPIPAATPGLDGGGGSDGGGGGGGDNTAIIAAVLVVVALSCCVGGGIAAYCAHKKKKAAQFTRFHDNALHGGGVEMGGDVGSI